jgi:ribonuclease VapC
MASKVLDSWALIAFFEDEPAAEAVEKLLQQAADEKHKLLMSVVSWGEVYYTMMRAVGREAAEQKAQEIAALPIKVVGVSEDRLLVRQAAVFKAAHRMSYADCFAAALAKQENAELITGDPEFKAVERDVKVSWLPPGAGTSVSSPGAR